MNNLFAIILDEKIIKVIPVSGGDINEAFRITTHTNEYFAKTNDIEQAFAMLESEARTLKLFSKIEGINVPAVRQKGKYGNIAFLILNWIESGTKTETYDFDFAMMLSRLHRTENAEFGFEFDNYIGSLLQINTWNKNWLDFYYQFRIVNQLKLAIDAGKIGSEYHRKLDIMFKNISLEFPHVVPSLLHGDLWAGNHMSDKQGKPVFIDPAACYGHREMDLAMMKLFGGFSDDIFRYYYEIFPNEYHWQERLQFYQLYYILVHVNLFGGSYINSAKSIIDRFGK